MKNYTLKDAAAASGGKYFGGEDLLALECANIVTDSRKVTPGSVFAAIPGERVDGHDFVTEAVRSGAVCAIVERPPEDGAPHILVSSTPAALRFIAADYRSRFKIPVIGVTGSVGKTSAKEMLARVLGRRFSTLCTEGNFNNELGVPLTLFRLEPGHEAAVIEMGISEFGEMTRLTRIVRPNAAVITSIGDAHLLSLGSREGVLKAKAEILDGMPTGSIAFVNGDDELLRGLKVAPRKKLTFGLNEGCDVRALHVENRGADGVSCTIEGLDRRFDVEIPAYGRHIVYAALAAAAVAMYFGLSEEQIAAGIAGYAPVGHRARAVDAGDITVVDDCYNANPTSVEMALQSLEDFAPRRRVAILGDMLELGQDEERFHYEAGANAARRGALTVACGPLSRQTAKGAEDAGGEALYFPTKEALLSSLGDIIRPRDAVLVKASRGMRFEDIVNELLKRG